MSQHAGEHVMIPSRILPYLIVIHTKFGFCFLKALLDGPAHTAEPYEEPQSRAQQSVTDVVGILSAGT